MVVGGECVLCDYCLLFVLCDYCEYVVVVYDLYDVG